jgi:hypothetical protein
MPSAVCLALAVAAATCVGCAHQSWVDPGGRWNTGASAHFVVHGDGTEGRVRDVLVRLEETHAALAAGFFPGVEIPRVEGIVFEDSDEYEEVAVPRTAGLFVPGVGHGGSLLVIRGDLEDSQFVDQIVAHELAHRFMAASYPALPVWLNEGFAMYVETVQVRDKGVLFGSPPVNELSVVNDGGAVPLEELMTARVSAMHGPSAQRYYASAWAFMHQVIHVGNGRFLARLPALLRGFERAPRTHEGALDVLAGVYPELSADEIEHGMFSSAAWMQGMGASRVLAVRLPRPIVHSQVQTANPAEIRELCLALRAHRGLRN